MTERMMGSLAGDLGEKLGRSYETLIGHITGLTIAVAGLGIVASAFVDLLRGGPDVIALTIIGLVATLAGFVLWRSRIHCTNC